AAREFCAYGEMLAKKLGSLEHPSLGERAARAVRLLTTTHGSDDALSAGLAHLHLERLLAQIRPETLWKAAKKRADVAKIVALSLLALALGAFAYSPLRVAEGVDVLLAYRGRAPIDIDWVESAVVDIQPPAYLGESIQHAMAFDETYQPVGTKLSVHARPRFDGRTLVLTDGKRETPFVDDAKGGIVATWTVEHDATLEIAARFGDVLIAQSTSLRVVALEDEAPKVIVDDTPRTVRLLDIQEVPIRYEITDDHGLTHVELVLRTAGKESRRSLAKHDGTLTFDRGATVLHRQDRVLVQAHTPVEVTIEARDNNAVGGPSWGKSQPIVVLPPAVGEEEALRFEAVQSLRNDLLDLLASRLRREAPSQHEDRAALNTKETKAHASFEQAANQVSQQSYGGIVVSRRMRAFIQGQLERLRKATDGACPTLSEQACRSGLRRLQDVTGDVALALDVATRTLSTRDSIAIARKLADVADEAAEGARQIRQSESQRGRVRLDASLEVLRGGSGSMLRLGGLGGDLGEIVAMGVRNIQRCMHRDDTQCAESAALHLAARLRSPHPSFSGGGGRSGTESGGMPGLDDASAGDGDMESFDSEGDEIEKLAKDHASRMEEVQQAIAEAMQSIDMQGLHDLAREHARIVRDSVRGLPTSSSDMSSLEGAAMVLREQAERMAAALERTALSEADQAASNALKAAEQAVLLGQRERDLFGQPSSLSREVVRARETLEREQRWVREQLDAMRKSASEQGKQRLKTESERQRELADRAKDVLKRARSGQEPIPLSTVELIERAESHMREAARALDRADGDQAMTLQRMAQRWLEMASESMQDTANSNTPSPQTNPSHAESLEGQRDAHGEGDGKNIAKGPVDIPKAEAFTGPESFRRRVMDGLSHPADPSLREAVRRYSEGLLR
ncbi:MAG TPA: DUF4175 domain-containing protein, partial [Polyangiaceae bacterium]|nr:DUF4175 domain-containing protein [Polyangiaceae bacterium]